MRAEVLYIAGGAVVLALGYVLFKNGRQVGQAVGGAAVDAVDGVVTGVVTTVGEKVGIPKTSKTQCEIDKAAGNTWAASFSCPAGDFISFWWNK